MATCDPVELLDRHIDSLPLDQQREFRELTVKLTKPFEPLLEDGGFDKAENQNLALATTLLIIKLNEQSNQ